MAYLTATDKPLYWAAQDSNGETYAADCAEAGGKIGIPPAHTAISDTDANAYLSKAVNTASGYKPLPAVGEWCEGGVIYADGSNLVICRQSHYRTTYLLADTPALWLVYRADAAGTLAWIVGEKVEIGMVRSYNSKDYRCSQAHVTQADWPPDKATTLWTLIPTTAEWAYPVAYKVGAIVTYLGKTYSCLQAHTSQAGWTPTAVPALWKLL